jgi:hypothetical protein
VASVGSPYEKSFFKAAHFLFEQLLEQPRWPSLEAALGHNITLPNSFLYKNEMKACLVFLIKLYN